MRIVSPLVQSRDALKVAISFQKQSLECYCVKRKHRFAFIRPTQSDIICVCIEYKTPRQTTDKDYSWFSSTSFPCLRWLGVPPTVPRADQSEALPDCQPEVSLRHFHPIEKFLRTGRCVADGGERRVGVCMRVSVCPRCGPAPGVPCGPCRDKSHSAHKGKRERGKVCVLFFVSVYSRTSHLSLFFKSRKSILKFWTIRAAFTAACLDRLGSTAMQRS